MINLRLFHIKDFADDNYELDENGGKLSKLVENNVGKGEIARYKQFLLFQQCFQNNCAAARKTNGLVWERVKILPSNKTETIPNWKHLQP